MRFTWIYIVILMLLGSLIIGQIPSVVSVIIVNLIVFILGVFLLKRDPFIELRSSVIFLGGVIGIKVLVSLGFMASLYGNIALILLIIWSFAGGGRKRY